MSYDNNNTNTHSSTSGGPGSSAERQHFDPSNAFSSGGMNNSTGREPFEDPRSDFAAPGAPPQAVAGNLHHSHHHDQGLSQGQGQGYSSSNQQSQGYSSTTQQVPVVAVGSTGSSSGQYSNNYDQDSSRRNVGDHPAFNDTRHHGDIRSGTSEDHLVGRGRDTGAGLTGGHLAGSQTGDAPGGVQTGSGSFGTGRDVAQDDRKMTDKIKDAVGAGNHGDHSHNQTVGKGAHVNQSMTGGHPGAGITGGSLNTYGSDSSARDYDNNTPRLGNTADSAAGYDRGVGGPGNQGVGQFQGSDSHGPVSGGAAGTDRFDSPRTSGTDSHTHTDRITGTGVDHGHSVGNKGSNDHKLSGLTRHGDDFTGGDTADSAYKNYDATGLSGRETTTTGVHDNNLEGTGAHKEGLLDKVKNVFGGHTNTTHADHK